MPRMASAEAASRMQEEQFEAWLRVEREQVADTVRSRISNCKRVERHEGDLDSHFDADGLAGLMDRLNPSGPEHEIPIDGNDYTGTATLKSAVRLYRDFRNAGGAGGSTGATVKPRPSERGNHMNRTEAKSVIADFLNTIPDEKQRADLQAALNAATAAAGAHWPAWSQPNDKDLLELARAMAPFTRFLDPDIVGAVVEDNRLVRAAWSTRLEALGIDPAVYLWEGSPCAFPGVRRYAGTKERELFRQRAAPYGCLALDDNDYPKHLWAFVFTGKPFRKQGPDGYQLAHLFDHKKHGNRWRDELVLPSGADEPAPLYGLFTSAANAIYTPVDFLRPTDGSPRLRSLIQRRAQQLYSGRCCLVPPPLEVTSCDDPDWAPSNFQWSASVGGTDHIGDFLAFRRERMDELIEKRQADAPR